MKQTYKPAFPDAETQRNDSLTGGQSRARTPISAGHGQTIKSAVALDNVGKAWGPTPSLLEDRFRQRDLLVKHTDGKYDDWSDGSADVSPVRPAGVEEDSEQR